MATLLTVEGSEYPSRTAPATDTALRPVPLRPLPERPLVSILMANYNYGAYIGEAIESVLAQSYDHWELLVADDGSTDDSCAIVERYVQRDGRIRLLPGPENRGQIHTVNRAYAASRGEIICLLDSDDTMTPDKLERVVDHFLAYPTVGLINHRALMVDADGTPVMELPYVVAFERGWIAERVIRRGGRWLCLAGCTMAFRREPGDLIFPIQENGLVRSADQVLIPMMPLLTEVSAIDAVLYRYRIHGRNDSGALGPTAARLEMNVRYTVGGITYVNRRLAELGMPECYIDYRRNVGYLQQTLELHLLQGVPRLQLARELRVLVPRLLGDDLYGRFVALARAANYGLTIMLPVALRARWLDATLGSNPVKQSLRGVVRQLRAVARRASGVFSAVRGAPPVGGGG